MDERKFELAAEQQEQHLGDAIAAARKQSLQRAVVPTESCEDCGDELVPQRKLWACARCVLCQERKEKIK